MDERIAIVTGANRGIGKAITNGLASAGVRVIAGCRRQDRIEETSKSFAANADTVDVQQLDVCDQESVERLLSYVEKTYHRCDILINNAGIFGEGRNALETSDEDILTVMQTNVLGVIRMCRAFVPLMRRQSYGRIVQLSSGLGQLSEMGGGNLSYRLSKASLNAFTRVLASELKDSGILVNSICPGWVHTDMGGAQAPRTPEEGADTAIWLATLGNDGPTGGFFRDRNPIPF